MKKIEKIFLLLLFLLAFFLRIYRLSQNPANFQRNEAFFGYNAYSLLKTGKDIKGRVFPLLFQYFEKKEHFLPVYTYLTIPSIAIFGLNELGVRFPSAFLGSLTVIFTYFLIKELLKKSSFSNIISSKMASQSSFRMQLSAISSFLLAISPWHLHFSRLASAASVSLFFIILGTFLFLKNKEKLSILAFCLSLFTYQGHWLFVILFNFVLLMSRKWRNSVRKNLWRFWCLFSFFLVIWLLNAATKTSKLVFGSLFFDEYFRDFSWLEKILQVLENYSDYFSFEFLFFSGDGYINHGVGEMGGLYLFTLPLFLMGIYQMFYQKITNKVLILFWWFISFLQPAFYRFPIDAGKSLPAIVPLLFFTSLGVVKVIQYLLTIKKKVFRFAFCVLLLLIFTYDLLTYFHTYWIHYFKKTQNQGEAAFKTVARLVKEKQTDYDYFFITNDTDGATLFTLFYLNYSPETFLEKRGTRSNFGKFFFDQVPLSQFLQEEKGKKITVVTSTHKAAPGGFNKVEEVKFLSGDVAFVLWEN